MLLITHQTDAQVTLGLGCLLNLACQILVRLLLMIQKLQFQTSSSFPIADSTVDTPNGKYRARLVKTVAELESLKTAWERLVEVAIHRNLFFDPDFLIPAIKHLKGSDVQVLVVDAPAKSNSDGERVLCGLIPLQKTKIYGFH